ncbi:MAG: DUF1343 domain-containing protein [Bacteroidetes bacterium]|nr:DUF1343 domain-containing protein [Bacteroidota bacterium]
MFKLHTLSALFLLFLMPSCATAQKTYVTPRLVSYNQITPGAHRTSEYFPLLQGRNVAVVTNQTGIIGRRHLVDVLRESGIKVVKIFTPEHGFRGDQDAGAWVEHSKDPQTGLPVISLYGRDKKPKDADLKDVSVILFDLQDVGVRFYTYISTLTYVMEVAAANDIPVVVLDRPNPNGFYVDGPVLEPERRSFVGLHPVPVVYGMTIGEYALMVNGEGWLGNGLRCRLTVVPLLGYQRDMIFQLPVRPSPNLPDWKSVYLYPSLCFFEGTVVSVGRGTPTPFRVYGHPHMEKGSFSFTPVSTPGAALNPLHMNVLCHGQDLTEFAENFADHKPQLRLEWLQSAYRQLSGRHRFFNNFFDNLAGNSSLRGQIATGLPEDQIRQSWQPGLQQFLQLRKKYLLYPDYE